MKCLDIFALLLQVNAIQFIVINMKINIIVSVNLLTIYYDF